MQVGAVLVGLFEDLENGDWNGTDSGRRRVFFCVGRDLLSQAKVKLFQLVVPGVIFPHSYKYLANQLGVLLHRPLLDGSPYGCQDSVTNLCRWYQAVDSFW